MKLRGIIAVAICAFSLGVVGQAEQEIVITYEGNPLTFNELPIIRNDKTLVQLRPIAEAMGLNIDYVNETRQVILSNGETSVVFTTDSDIINVNGVESVMLAPMCNHNDYTFVPIRDLAEPFGKVVSYDPVTKGVGIDSPVIDGEGYVPEEANPLETPVENTWEAPVEETENQYWYTEDAYSDGMLLRPGAVELLPARDVSSGSGLYSSYYYYQSQPDMELENNGKGYCWVCSYAMLLSNVTGVKVTPIDVANVNIMNGFSGNFMFHSAIVDKYGCEFVPALPEGSPYLVSYNEKQRGDTVILTDSDASVIAALKQALDLHPAGVLVRFDGFPHTMLAVGYEGDTIYYNEPGLANAEHVTFSQTCLSKYKLTDITFIQAIAPAASYESFDQYEQFEYFEE